MPEVKDFMGRLVNAGDTIVYPVRRKSDMNMKELRVQQVVDTNPPYITGYNTEGRRVTVKNLDNIVAVPPRVIA